MFKSGLIAILAGTFALAGCVGAPSSTIAQDQVRPEQPQVEQRDQIGQQRDQRGRVRQPRRIARPSWWGSRTWRGRSTRPVWWGQRPYVANSYILINGYYYPYYFVNGYYYPEYTTPYVIIAGRFHPYYGSEPGSAQEAIPARSARLVNVRPEERAENEPVEQR